MDFVPSSSPAITSTFTLTPCSSIARVAGTTVKAVTRVDLTTNAATSISTLLHLDSATPKLACSQGGTFAFQMYYVLETIVSSYIGCLILLFSRRREFGLLVEKNQVAFMGGHLTNNNGFNSSILVQSFKEPRSTYADGLLSTWYAIRIRTISRRASLRQLSPGLGTNVRSSPARPESVRGGWTHSVLRRDHRL